MRPSLTQPLAYGLSLVTILLFFSPAIAQDEPVVIGQIEFFGYAGLDLKSIKSALPIKEGDAIRTAELPGLTERIKQSIRSKLGRSATGLSFVCCEGQGNWMVFIGLPGATWQSFTYRPPPKGSVQLSKKIIGLYERALTLTLEAVQKQSVEDRSKGYALMSRPCVKCNWVFARSQTNTLQSSIGCSKIPQT